jgi:hypothetical protein
MYFYEYHKKSQEVLEMAKEKFAHLFEGTISDESIEARYCLLEFLLQKFGHIETLKNDESGRPIPLSIDGKTYYWSISHSKNYTAYILSENPVGIDIAESEVRDISLLDAHTDGEYAIL